MSNTLLVPVLRPEPDAVACLSLERVRHYRCVPLERDDAHLKIAVENPRDLALIAEIEFLTGLRVDAVAAGIAEIKQAVDRAYRGTALSVPSGTPDRTPDRRDPPVVRIVRFLLDDAVRSGASDIHIDPGPAATRIRYRVDGAVHDRYRLPGWLHAQLIARIKVLAHLDISERRLGQDGLLVDAGAGIEARVSTVPTTRGEAGVVRLFRHRDAPPRLVELGGEAIATRLRAIGNRPQGMLIVAGPTGSGKTTTLYALIAELVEREINIVTIEDPVEFRVDRVRQIQVDGAFGFERALRSVLRQDPDLILVGEIRDAETARTAFGAALTGHLVLATLHATDAMSVLVRLGELGIDPSLAGTALVGAVAQRLVRTNCSACVRAEVPERFYLDRLGMDAGDLSGLGRGTGCLSCRFTGFAGRTPFFEILEVNGAVRSAIAREDRDGLARAAREAGMEPIIEQVLAEVRQGRIAADEAYRTCYFGDGR